jgi:hypothetical protein
LRGRIIRRLADDPFGVMNSKDCSLAILREISKNKALLLSQQGFFFVAECDEISNLELIRDID